jgi:restriction modification system DNA specificity domain protein
MEWKTVRLGDYISIKSGLAYKGCHIGKGENLLLGMGCVSFKEKFVETGARPYNDPSDDRFVVSPGDIVLATRQQSDNLPILAMPAIIPNIYQNKRVLFGTNLYKIENNSEIDNRFLFWLLKHQHYVNYIAGVKSGTAVQMVTKKNVENYKFSCPPKFIRDKISKTLWDYDRLIENNTHRIRLLEQMAENLYKEWFVRFRFPEHENVEMVNGLPKGWKINSLKEICEFKRGRNITSAEMCDGIIQVISAGVAPSGYHNKANVHGVSVTMSSSGANAGYISIHYDDIWAADCSYISEKETEDIYYVYELLNNIRQVINNFQIGAAQPHVYPKDINRIKTCVPPKELRIKANTNLSKIHKEIHKLYKQNQLLTRQRDLLLPRLMSGKLEVKS